MGNNPLCSLDHYSRFVAITLNRPDVAHSTVSVWSDSPYTGTAEGEVFFLNGVRLRLHQELDFEACIITSYGYEVYRGNERLYWYDDFPHPNTPELASSFPHHKHIHPNIKHNRIPAPNISFTQPNLPMIVNEIEELLSISL